MGASGLTLTGLTLSQVLMVLGGFGLGAVILYLLKLRRRRVEVPFVRLWEQVLAEKQWLRHAWGEMTADLSKWAGQRVRIKLIADVGPKDNSSGDWACWADLRIEAAGPVVEIAVHDSPPSPARQKGRRP